MDKIKTKVIKSKSSNTTIAKDSTQNKKSYSNAEIQLSISSKKRGVYVEKKATKSSITEQFENLPKKPKVIRRPGKKRFLDSILTILSKSTTGTQFPDLPEDTKKMKARRRKLYEQNVIGDLTSVKKQPKYRSRILNEMRDLDLDKVVILQSKKEIIQTPSNNSQRSKDRESIKWSDLVTSLPTTESNITVINTNAKDPQRSLLEHIESGKENIEKNVAIIYNDDEPVTLVSKETEKDDDKLYDFFVDLLESTFNVYKTKTEPIVSNKSSKLALASHESVTKKTNTENTVADYINFISHSESKPKYDCHLSEDWDDSLLEGATAMSLRDITLEMPSTKSKKQLKLKTKPQLFTYSKKKPKVVTRSFISPKTPTPPKRLYKKDRKKNLLNLFKEQLKIEADIYEPPKNFFESLQMMAKYKNRCQKSTRFEESIKKTSEQNVYDCMYKRRRVLSASSYSKKQMSNNYVHSNRSIRSLSCKSVICNRSKSYLEYHQDNDGASRLSLAVYAYDMQPTATTSDKPPQLDRFQPSTSTVCCNSSVCSSVVGRGSFTQW